MTRRTSPRNTAEASALQALEQSAQHLTTAANVLWIAGRFNPPTARDVVRVRKLIAQALLDLDTARRIKS